MNTLCTDWESTAININLILKHLIRGQIDQTK